MGMPERFTSGPLLGSGHISSLVGGFKRPGCVWGSRTDVGSFDPTKGSYINVLCDVSHNVDTSGRLWVLDGIEGALVPVVRNDYAHRTNDGARPYPNPLTAPWISLVGGPGAAVDVATMLIAEPPRDGRTIVWRFGIAEDLGYGGALAIGLDGRSFQDGAALTEPIVEKADYAGVTGDTLDFAIDRQADLVWWRTSDMNEGTIKCFRYTNHAFVADLWVPRASSGILATGEGHVWIVADELLFRYTYAGVEAGWCANPRDPVAGGACYGWDPVGRRLLLLEVTEPEIVDELTVGTSVVRGFWPIPLPEHLTPAIPRQPPRKNRVSFVFAHLCGVGGEPITSRLALASNDDVTTPTDAQGDIVKRILPDAAGTLVCNLAVARLEEEEP